MKLGNTSYDNDYERPEYFELLETYSTARRDVILASRFMSLETLENIENIHHQFFILEESVESNLARLLI